MPGPTPIRRPVTRDDESSAHSARAQQILRKLEREVDGGATALTKSETLALAQVHATLALVPRSRRPERTVAGDAAALRGEIVVPNVEPWEPSEAAVLAAIGAIDRTRQLSTREQAVAVLVAAHSVEAAP